MGFHALAPVRAAAVLPLPSLLCFVRFRQSPMYRRLAPSDHSMSTHSARQIIRPQSAPPTMIRSSKSGKQPGNQYPARPASVTSQSTRASQTPQNARSMAQALQQPRFVQDVAAPLTTSQTQAQIWVDAMQQARAAGARACQQGKRLSLRLTVDIFRTQFAKPQFKGNTVYSTAVREAVQEGWTAQSKLQPHGP